MTAISPHLAGICGGEFIQCTTPEFRLYNILIPSPLQHYHSIITPSSNPSSWRKAIGRTKDLVKFNRSSRGFSSFHNTHPVDCGCLTHCLSHLSTLSDLTCIKGHPCRMAHARAFYNCDATSMSCSLWLYTVSNRPLNLICHLNEVYSGFRSAPLLPSL